MILLGFVALALCSVGLFYGARGAFALLTRGLDIAERRTVLLERQNTGPAVPKSIPPDLFRRITKWVDPDAQDLERKILLDLYNEFRDEPDPWIEVRNHLPAEPNEDIPTELFLE